MEVSDRKYYLSFSLLSVLYFEFSFLSFIFTFSSFLPFTIYLSHFHLVPTIFIILNLPAHFHITCIFLLLVMNIRTLSLICHLLSSISILFSSHIFFSVYIFSFKKGAFQMAKAAGVKIVPVSIGNLHRSVRAFTLYPHILFDFIGLIIRF